jgi:hypothetical protein
MPMPTAAAIWTKLAEYSRSLANETQDPQSRKHLFEIAERYEALARRSTAQEADNPG